MCEDSKRQKNCQSGVRTAQNVHIYTAVGPLTAIVVADESELTRGSNGVCDVFPMMDATFSQGLGQVC